jgi:tRNA-dihydrouridine synthase A
LMPYIEREVAAGTRLYAIVRHVLGLFHAVPGARLFRRHLATYATKAGADVGVFREALALISPNSSADPNSDRLPSYVTTPSASLSAAAGRY